MVIKDVPPYALVYGVPAEVHGKVNKEGDTVFEDYVKLDALIHTGHESWLGKNTEITADGIISGFVKMEEHSYLGVNSTVKNRINLGRNCIIGMGANVTKSVPDNCTVAGNPAKPLVK